MYPYLSVSHCSLGLTMLLGGGRALPRAGGGESDKGARYDAPLLKTSKQRPVILSTGIPHVFHLATTPEWPCFPFYPRANPLCAALPSYLLCMVPIAAAVLHPPPSTVPAHTRARAWQAEDRRRRNQCARVCASRRRRLLGVRDQVRRGSDADARGFGECCGHQLRAQGNGVPFVVVAAKLK